MSIDPIPDFGPGPPPSPELRALFPNSPELFREQPAPTPPDPRLARMFPNSPGAEQPAKPPAPGQADPARALFPNSPELFKDEPQTAEPGTQPEAQAAEPAPAEIPQAYADLAAPEGFEINQARFAPVAVELGKLGVSREQAQGLLGVYARMEAEVDASVQAENERWRQEALRQVPPADITAAQSLVRAAPKEVAQVFMRTGIGNHPAIVRWVADLARQLRKG